MTKNSISKHEFNPTGFTQFTHRDGSTDRVLCEHIQRAGKCIVVTAHTTNGGGVGYGLTHTLTGATLTGEKLADSPAKIRTLARRLWSLLTPEQRTVWQSSDDRAQIQAATPLQFYNELASYRSV